MTGLAGSVTATADLATRALTVVREGELWRLEREDTVVRVKDSRGMQLLARLVEQRGSEVHVLALASDEGTSAPESDAGEVARRDRAPQLSRTVCASSSPHSPRPSVPARPRARASSTASARRWSASSPVRPGYPAGRAEPARRPSVRASTCSAG